MTASANLMLVEQPGRKADDTTDAMIDRESRFKMLVSENQDAVYRICLSYVRDAEARNDVYQEVLVHLWRSLDSFEGRSAISTWVYRIAVNTCLAYLRAERRRTSVIAADAGPGVLDVADDRERSVDTELDIAQLYDEIRKLDPVERALVSLYLEDVSTGEIAEILGISEGNVRVKLHRIKKTLQQNLGGENHGSR